MTQPLSPSATPVVRQSAGPPKESASLAGMGAVSAREHVVASGKTLPAKYKGLGFKDQHMHPGPGHLLGLIVGFTSSGKSSFAQSNPDGYVYNADLSSTTNPKPSATIWPGIGEDGYPIDPVEGRIEPTWERYLAKRDLLVQMAREDVPGRPTCAFLDTLGMVLPIVKQFVVRNAVELGMNNKGASCWNDLHGPAAWDEVYTQLTEFGLSHRRAGLGFFYMLHLTTRVVQMGESLHEKVYGVNITDNFWSRLFPLFEIAMAVFPETVPEVGKREQRMPGGKTRTITETKEVHRRVLVTDAYGQGQPELRHVVKNRVQIPGKVILPPSGQWPVFEKAYKDAVDAASSAE